MKHKLLKLFCLALLPVLPVLGDQVVINEIMYHPAPDVPEDTGQEWVELYNKGPTSVNLNGWKLTKTVDFTFPNTTLPADGYLVVAANVSTFHTRYPSVANVVGNWTG